MLSVGAKKQKWLPGTHGGTVATTPLPSRGSATLSVATKNRYGYLAAISVFCPWAVRPAVRCPAVGEGPRGRQRHLAVKLTPMIIPPDYGCHTNGNGRSSGRTEGTFVDGRSVRTTLYRGLFFYWPESGDPFKKSRKMKFYEIRFRLHFCERHRKTIHMAFGISKNGSDFAVWRRVQVAKKRQFSKTRVIWRQK